MSGLKTILFLAALVAMGAGFLNVRGLKVSHGVGLAMALVIVANLVPENNAT